MLNRTRSVLRSTFAKVLVEWGVALDRQGAKHMYDTDPYEHYCRHKPIHPVDASKPTFAPGAKIAYTASIEGAVQLQSNVTVGRQSILRADLAPIRIGDDTIVGDNVVFYTTELHQLIPGSIDIGSNVLIGDRAVLKSCIVDDGAYIGEGSFIAEGAIVQRGAIVLPSTTVQPGAVLTEGKVWGGNPCREISDISDKYVARVQERVKNFRAASDAFENDVIYMQMPNVNAAVDVQPENQHESEKVSK